MYRFHRPRTAGFVCALACALPWAGLTLPVQAQGMSPLPVRHAGAAADPATTVSPPAWPLLPTEPSADLPALPEGLAGARAQWQRVNEQVAAFARGHIDLLRWEQAQSANVQATGPARDTTAPKDQLGPQAAVADSLRQRPDLFTRPEMNPRERAEVQAGWASHVQAVNKAWIDAVAARARAALMAQAHEATRTGAELGRRMVVAGNWSQARQMREQLTETAAWHALVAARLAERAAIESLASRLGLWRAADVTALAARLPDGLPALPETPWPGQDVSADRIESMALQADAGLSLMRAELERDLRAADPAREAVLRAQMERALAGSDPNRPPHIEALERAGDAAAERSLHAQARLLAQAAERRSAARMAWQQVAIRHATARQASEGLVKLQQALDQENLLRYNGMLQSTWDLLSSARERIAALDTALQARAAYWRALADGQALLAGAPASAIGLQTDAPAATGGSAAPAGH